MAHRARLLGMLFLASLLGAPAEAVDKAVAALKDASGKDVGKAAFTDTASGVLIRLDLISMPPGDHAFHVHEVNLSAALIFLPLLEVADNMLPARA